MNKIMYSKHSRARFQQRGFSKTIVELLIQYGDRSIWQKGRGVLCVSFAKKSLYELSRSKSLDESVKSVIKKNFELLQKKVLLITDDVVITAFNHTRGAVR